MSVNAKPFYVGSFRHALDAKNRLTIPRKWRFAGDETDTYMALPHPDGYVMVLPPAEVDKLYERISSQRFSDPVAQALQNKLFSQAFPFSYDSQGRVCLPESLLKRAGITRECVLVGTMTKFGIWSPEKWAEIDPETNGDNLTDLMSQAGL